LGKYGSIHLAPIYVDLFSALFKKESIARFPDKDVSEIDHWLGGMADERLDTLRVKPDEDQIPLLLLDRDYRGKVKSFFFRGGVPPSFLGGGSPPSFLGGGVPPLLF